MERGFWLNEVKLVIYITCRKTRYLTTAKIAKVTEQVF